MKLLCDQMLGSLAKWLRILGFDTFFANSKLNDNQLLNIAKKENRIIISRDKEFIKAAIRNNIRSIQIYNIDLDEQLSQVLKQLKIDKEKILSRCTICNSKIIKVNKTDIKDKVPIKVFENNDIYWFCDKCKKYYWTGSHYDKIKQKLEELLKN
jgi:uncharacterized protein with PIN domain